MANRTVPTRCRRGHEYDAENTLLQTHASGRQWRRCRACDRERYLMRELRHSGKSPVIMAPQAAFDEAAFLKTAWVEKRWRDGWSLKTAITAARRGIQCGQVNEPLSMPSPRKAPRPITVMNGAYAPAMDYAAIGRELGISRERVRQICNRALRKMARKQTALRALEGLSQMRQEACGIPLWQAIQNMAAV